MNKQIEKLLIYDYYYSNFCLREGQDNIYSFNRETFTITSKDNREDISLKEFTPDSKETLISCISLLLLKYGLLHTVNYRINRSNNVLFYIPSLKLYLDIPDSTVYSYSSIKKDRRKKNKKIKKKSKDKRDLLHPFLNLTFSDSMAETLLLVSLSTLEKKNSYWISFPSLEKRLLKIIGKRNVRS